MKVVLQGLAAGLLLACTDDGAPIGESDAGGSEGRDASADVSGADAGVDTGTDGDLPDVGPGPVDGYVPFVSVCQEGGGAALVMAVALRCPLSPIHPATNAPPWTGRERPCRSRRTDLISGEELVVEYDYDAPYESSAGTYRSDGQLETHRFDPVLPDAELEYVYDGSNRMVGVVPRGDNVLTDGTFEIEYDGGLVTAEYWVTPEEDRALATRFVRDEAGRLLAEEVELEGQTFRPIRFAYDEAGRRIRAESYILTNPGDPDADPSHIWEYTWENDRLVRATCVTNPDLPFPVAECETSDEIIYDYDCD